MAQTDEHNVPDAPDGHQKGLKEKITDAIDTVKGRIDEYHEHEHDDGLPQR